MQRIKWKSAEFVSWMYDRKTAGQDVHHLLLKQNSDLFLVNIKADVHAYIHLRGYLDGQFEERFLQALKNIQEYITYLEELKQYTTINYWEGCEDE